MATHDYNIANQGAAAFRSDLNNALSAILSQNSGGTAPTTTTAGMLWYDTTNNVIKQRNSTDTGWITLWAEDKQGFIPQDGSSIYAADAGANDTYAITLAPAPTAYTTGMVVNFKANTLNTGAATLNVNSLGAKTIKKSYNSDLETGDILANQLVSVIYDGTNFQLLSRSSLATTPTAAQGASWTYLGSATASGSTALVFESLFSSTYDEYVIDMVSLVPATDGASFGLQYRIGGSYITANYRWGANQPTENASGNSGGSGQSLIGVLPATGNASGESASGLVRIYNPLSASLYKLATFQGNCTSTTTTHIATHGGGFYSAATTALDGARIIASSGNITSGAAHLYGVKKA